MRFSYSLHHHIIALYTAAPHTPPSVAMRSRRLSAPADGRPESARARCTRAIATRSRRERCALRHYASVRVVLLVAPDATRVERRGSAATCALRNGLARYRSTLRKGSRPKILARSTCRYLQPISNCMITLCRPKSQR